MKLKAYTFAQRLRPFAKRCGVTLVCVDEVPVLLSAPFDSLRLGADRIHRRILFTKDAPATGLIHELGHLLFEGPFSYRNDEYDWFGWEHVVAQQLGVEDEWIEQNSDYGTEDGDFGTLSPYQKKQLLKERRQIAHDCGFLDVTPKPFNKKDLR